MATRCQARIIQSNIKIDVKTPFTKKAAPTTGKYTQQKRQFGSSVTSWSFYSSSQWLWHLSTSLIRSIYKICISLLMNINMDAEWMPSCVYFSNLNMTSIQILIQKPLYLARRNVNMLFQTHLTKTEQNISWVSIWMSKICCNVTVLLFLFWGD